MFAWVVQFCFVGYPSIWLVCESWLCVVSRGARKTRKEGTLTVPRFVMVISVLRLMLILIPLLIFILILLLILILILVLYSLSQPKHLAVGLGGG